MLRINSLGVALMMVLMITVGCGSTQTKSPVMLEGAYRFSNIVTESNCMKPGVTKGARVWRDIHSCWDTAPPLIGESA